jgi:flavin-dependent dehydrogenase
MKSAKILSDVIAEGCDPEDYEERWNRLYLKKFSILLRLEKLFLHYDLMTHVMMKTLERSEVRKKLLTLWMDQYNITLNVRFFVTLFKNLFK